MQSTKLVSVVQARQASTNRLSLLLDLDSPKLVDIQKYKKKITLYIECNFLRRDSSEPPNTYVGPPLMKILKVWRGLPYYNEVLHPCALSHKYDFVDKLVFNLKSRFPNPMTNY